MRNVIPKREVKRIIAFILFLFLTWQIFIHLTYLFRGADWSAYNVFAYRNEKEDSIDVVLVGGSSVYRFWNPLQAYKEHGFTSYDYTSSNFPASIAVSAMDELRKTQNPKLIVLDIRTFHTRLWDITHPGGVRLYVDSMAPSLNRVKAINYHSKMFDLPLSEAVTYYLDIMYYHTNKSFASEVNWSLADHEISDATMKATGYFDHGFLPGVTHYYFEAPEDRSETSAILRDNIKQCFTDLLEYVNSSDISILLVESPFIPLENDVEEMNALIQLAIENHVPILNANEYVEEMGLDYRTDFYDTNHVNILGAEKYTNFLGKYLAEHYDLPDHRKDEDYSDWDSSYKEYMEQADQLKEQTWEIIHQKDETIRHEETIRQTVDPLEWLALTDDPNLTLLYSQKTVVNKPSEVAVSSVKHLGLSFSPGRYIGVYSGTLQYGNSTESEYSGMIDMMWDTMDDIPYFISEDAICVDSQEFLVESQGITFVVVDKNTMDVVDYAVVNIDTEGRLALRHKDYCGYTKRSK